MAAAAVMNRPPTLGCVLASLVFVLLGCPRLQIQASPVSHHQLACRRTVLPRLMQWFCAVSDSFTQPLPADITMMLRLMLICHRNCAGNLAVRMFHVKTNTHTGLMSIFI